MKKSCANRGFTLVELSVVLVIAGILLFGATSVIDIATNKARIDATNNTLAAIERALTLHYLTVGDLPCPADGTDATNDSNFGVAQETSEGTCDIDNIGISGAASGVVPTRSLSLPDTYMHDGWGARISYVVDDSCTDNTDWDTCASSAAITILDNTDSGSAGFGSEDERTSSAAYVVMSHGKNSAGAYNRSGNLNTTSSEAYEAENTDADANFKDDFIRDWDDTLTGSGVTDLDGTYFDDIVVWKTEPQISYED